MGVRTEWSSANTNSIELVPPLGWVDANGTTNKQTALLMGDNEVFVVEGSLLELKDFLQEGLIQVNTALQNRAW